MEMEFYVFQISNKENRQTFCYIVQSDYDSVFKMFHKNDESALIEQLNINFIWFTHACNFHQFDHNLCRTLVK